MNKRTIKKRNSFGQGLKRTRRAVRMSQEEFGGVSSRTYVSSLERGEYSPTLDKVDDLAYAMSIHPLTLVASGYFDFRSTEAVRTKLEPVIAELEALTAQRLKRKG